MFERSSVIVRVASVLVAVAALVLVPGRALAYKSCLANIETSTRLVDDSRNVYTWAPLASSNGEDPAGRLRAVLGAPGFRMLGEDTVGAQHTFRARLLKDGWQDVDLRLTTDAELRVASVLAHIPDGHATATLESEAVLCALMETIFPTGEQLPSNSSIFASRRAKAAQDWKAGLDAQFRTDLDALYARALAAGRAILIVPTVNLDARYSGQDTQRRPEEFWQDLTSMTRWTRVGGGGIAVGNHGGDEFAGIDGFHHSIVSRGLRYLVYVVHPGRYDLEGIGIDVKNAKLPTLHAKPATPGVGTVDLSPGKYTAYYHEQEWRDARFEDRTIKTDYCSLTIVGGPCVQWSTQTDTVKEMTRQAGYYDATKSYSADMLRVDAHVRRPFASFEAKPGEVLVTDGLFAQHPSVGFDTGACELTDSGARCPITELALVRLVAKLEDLESEGAAKGTQAYPNLRAAFAKASYRPLVLAAKGDALVPALGQVYSVGR